MSEPKPKRPRTDPFVFARRHEVPRADYDDGRPESADPGRDSCRLLLVTGADGRMALVVAFLLCAVEDVLYSVDGARNAARRFHQPRTRAASGQWSTLHELQAAVNFSGADRAAEFVIAETDPDERAELEEAIQEHRGPWGTAGFYNQTEYIDHIEALPGQVVDVRGPRGSGNLAPTTTVFVTRTGCWPVGEPQLQPHITSSLMMRRAEDSAWQRADVEDALRPGALTPGRWVLRFDDELEVTLEIDEPEDDEPDSEDE
jgi:hypothetical protein